MNQTKYKQAKSEANAAQNALQKEITTLRESNRTLQLKLRDIEVANDDFERQARHTTSSLEDLESKYNVAIERGVLLEEEIRNGELERESLRIETQRLRDELSDLKIETHIVQEKLRKAESSKGKHARKITPSDSGVSTQRSTDNNAEHSPTTMTSSPMVSTPPAKSISSITSDIVTPPSPPFSETSTTASKTDATPSVRRGRPLGSDAKGFTRTSLPSRASRHSRNPSISTSNGRATPSVAARQRAGVLESDLRIHVRGLVGQAQKLHQRVQRVWSQLPAPPETPPKGSPRSNSVLDQGPVPTSITMRSTRKRTSGSVASSREGDSTPYYLSYHRSSIGTSQHTPSRGDLDDSRPSSRTSATSHYSRSQSGIPQRPDSRLSNGSSRTPGGYSSQTLPERHRPRSSLSNYNPMSYIEEYGGSLTTPTPRRTVLNRADTTTSAIPTPSSTQKMQSGTSIPMPRRASSRLDRRDSDMPPPPTRTKPTTIDLGETY